jgi:hypothetical protein
LEAIKALKIRTGSAFEEAFHDATGDVGSSALSSMTCSWLTPTDQKVLALELSKCHMTDLGRPLFHFDNTEDHNLCLEFIDSYGEDESSNDTISKLCLSNLSDAGINTYTHFFSYVNQLCTRLLSEIMLGQYYETSVHLARSSKVAEAKLQILIEQQDGLFNTWNERQEHVLSMYDQLESHVEEQTYGLESKIKAVRQKLEKEHEHWKEEYKHFQEALKGELRKHQDDFEMLSAMVRKSRGLASSWTTGVSYLMKAAGISYSLFQGFLLNVGGLFCVWVFTLPSIFRWMRSSLMLVVMLELMIEIAILLKTQSDTEDEDFWKNVYFEQNQTLRSWLFYGCTTYYFIGIVRSIFYCCRRRRHAETNNNGDDSMPDTSNEEVTHEQVQQQSHTNPQFGVPAFEPFGYRATSHIHPYGPVQYGAPLRGGIGQPIMFPGATRATSRDDSAEATDASHETNDHGAIPYYDHPYMCIVAPPPTAQNSPRAGALPQMPLRTSNPRPTNSRPHQQHAALAAAQTLAAIQERNPSTVPRNINPSNRTEVDISTEQQQVIVSVSKDHNHGKNLAAKRKLSKLSEDNENVEEEEEEEQPSTKRSCKDANDSSTGSSSNDEDGTYDNHDDDEEEITSDRTCNTDDMEEEDECDDNDRDDDDDEFKDAVMEHERN